MRQWFLLVLFCAASAAEPSGLVGPQGCAPCHQAQYDTQVQSHHAAALRRGAEISWPAREITDRDFIVQYLRSGDAMEVNITGPHGPAVGRIEWAFGAGAQGITPVGIQDGSQAVRWFEHHFSYYTKPGRFAPTFGHPPAPGTAGAELGVPLSRGTVLECFNCHATGVQPGPNGPDVADMIPGVTCERCHGPGAPHVAAAKAGASPAAMRRSIVNPGRFAAKQQLELCGQCHRLPAADVGAEPEIEDPVTVRFAPVGLSASRCFRESGRLRCTTCHDPHANARPRSDFAAYAPKCLGCHQGVVPAGSKCARAVSRDCVGCHMPVAALGPYLRFTDHRIRTLQLPAKSTTQPSPAIPAKRH